MKGRCGDCSIAVVSPLCWREKLVSPVAVLTAQRFFTNDALVAHLQLHLLNDGRPEDADAVLEPSRNET